jgi:hypothetical protein
MLRSIDMNASNSGGTTASDRVDVLVSRLAEDVRSHGLKWGNVGAPLTPKLHAMAVGVLKARGSRDSSRWERVGSLFTLRKTSGALPSHPLYIGYNNQLQTAVCQYNCSSVLLLVAFHLLRG